MAEGNTESVKQTENTSITEKHKKEIIKELIRLDSMKWYKDKEVARSIFPYVLVEAVNILKNSKIIVKPVDYCKTGKDLKKMKKEILGKLTGKLSKRQTFFHYMCVLLSGDETEERATNLLPEEKRIKGIRLWLYKIFSYLNYVEGNRLVKKYKTHNF